jgi:cysteinyl-tRNA synthetase
MGIYITQPSSDEEDIQFIQELISNGKAYISNGKIYHQSEDPEDPDTILWETCDKGIKERFPGDPGCLDTPWGYGRYTQQGYNFLFIKLQSLGRTSSTY